MWHLTLVILCVTCCVQANQPNSHFQTPNNGRNNYADFLNLNSPSHSNVVPQEKSQFIDNHYNLKESPLGTGLYYQRSNNNNELSEPQTLRSEFFQGPHIRSLDSDDGFLNSESDVNFRDTSYFENLELVRNFAKYLKQQTQIDTSSRSSFNDAAHQYSALLTVINALVRVIKNSCLDTDKVYDQVYSPTVDTYYNYGLVNADKTLAMIDEYIKQGDLRMPKLRKLKETCGNGLRCVLMNDTIKSNPLMYVKELEILEALTRLARSFHPYISEFYQAARQGVVLPYLKENKDRLKEYVMHAVNSVEHLSDHSIRC